MIHPDTEVRKRADAIGYGVFATSFIPLGTITYAKDPLDIDISPAMYRELSSSSRRQVDKYSYVEPSGVRVLSWDIAKYVNHSCEPNTLSTGWGFEIAVRNIGPGEEITDEYGLFNLDEAMACQCDSSICRRTIRPSDILHHADSWDDEVRRALVDIPAVRQPLYSMLPADIRSDIESYFERRELYRSVTRLLLECEGDGGAVTSPTV
jgi:hypothetical protein